MHVFALSQSRDEKNFQIFSSVFVFYLFTRICWHSNRGKLHSNFFVRHKFVFCQLYSFILTLFVFVYQSLKVKDLPIVVWCWLFLNWLQNWEEFWKIRGIVSGSDCLFRDFALGQYTNTMNVVLFNQYWNWYAFTNYIGNNKRVRSIKIESKWKRA